MYLYFHRHHYELQHGLIAWMHTRDAILICYAEKSIRKVNEKLSLNPVIQNVENSLSNGKLVVAILSIGNLLK